MKKLLAFALLGSSLFAGVSPLKADIFYGTDYLIDGDDRYIEVFSFNNSTNVKTKLGRYLYSDDGGSSYINNFTPATLANTAKQYNASEGKIIIYGSTNGNPNTTGKYIEFDVTQKTWSSIEDISGENSTFTPVMTTGWASSTDITSNSNNISTNTSNISTNTSNISTNTSNIKNLGEGVAGTTALTAALTALPQTSKESKLSCGVGTGAYSSRYAVGFGCASKVNERVDINAGGSYVFGGSKSYGEGTLDSGVIKAGFVFKLGELKQSTQISMKEKEELKQEISDLKANNINIISQNKALLARLERLEKVALGESKSKDLATIKLPY